MKAARVNEYGKPAQVEDVPHPQPASDELLVRVHSASVNPVDTAIQHGYLSFMTTVPHTVGTDFSGVVVELGKDVTGFKVGDEVYGLIPMGSGTFSEYATPKAAHVSHKPKSLDHDHSSTIPLPAMAAWQSLYELGEYKTGDRVLILGVGGNVGGLAAQLAKANGAYVYGADIPDKAEHIASLGIDRYIDVSKERFEDVVKDLDIVLDFVGGEMTARSYSVLKRGGRYVTALMMQTPQEEAEKLGIISRGLAAEPRAEILKKITEMVDAGKLKFFVNRTFRLHEVNDAMNHRLSTKAHGKVVIKIHDDKK